MKIRKWIVCVAAAGVLASGCTTRYIYHGEGSVVDSKGKPIAVSLYRTETCRVLGFDKHGDVVWLITKDRPNVRLQFDEVDGVDPLAAEKRPVDRLVLHDKKYPDNIGGALFANKGETPT